MKNYKIPLILQCLTLIIPLNFYMWGDWMIVNLQWALFRYQLSINGSSLFLFHRDISFILMGYSTGIFNILASVLWTAGTLLLLAAAVVAVVVWSRNEGKYLAAASYLTCGAAGIYTVSALLRFPSGFAIPVGVPVLFAIAWYVYRQQDSEDEDDDENDGGNDAAGKNPADPIEKTPE